jgi:hypothetical protein
MPNGGRWGVVHPQRCWNQPLTFCHDEGTHHEADEDAYGGDEPEVGGGVGEIGADRHAEESGEGGEGEEERGHDVQAMGGAGHDFGALGLCLGLLGDGEAESELGILEEELGGALDAGGLIAQIDQIAVGFDEFAGLLQGTMHAARAAQDRGDGFEDGVLLGGGLCGVLGFVEFFEPCGIGCQMVLQGETAAVFGAGFPCAIGLAPKQGGLADGVIRPGQQVEDDEQVLFFEDGALRPGLAADAIADGLGDSGPKFRDDLEVWFHEWEGVSRWHESRWR